jgi:hypothetical protein
MTHPTLQEQLIDALVQMQKIPGMKKVLQPSIDALKDTSRTHVPEGDYKNVADFKDLILENHEDKIQTDKDKKNAKALIELAQTYPEEKQTREKKTKMK